HLTPLSSAGDLDEATLRRYLDWLIDQGIQGLFPAGSTGEFVRFDEATWHRVVRVVCEHAAGRITVVAGAASPGVQETVKRCDAFKELGVDALVLVAPYYFPLSDDAVFAFFDAVATRVQHPIFLYHIPALANGISIPNIVRLAEEHPHIVGIKDSGGDVSRMAETIHAVGNVRDDFVCLTGYDAALAPMLAVGAQGGMVASSGIVPEVMLAIERLYKSGKVDAAMDLQRRFVPLFNEMIRVGSFPDGFRLGALARGFDLGPSWLPDSLDAATKQQAAERIQATILELLEHVPA
ncbi:MAG: dihydrodipicolinate synthase family protein, partial [Planctomycetota bacterium]